jgi:hypothetical protein
MARKMSKQELDPPREAWETAEYEDDPFELGDIDESRLKIVSKDFLPRPEELVFKQARRKVAKENDGHKKGIVARTTGSAAQRVEGPF